MVAVMVAAVVVVVVVVAVVVVAVAAVVVVVVAAVAAVVVVVGPDCTGLYRPPGPLGPFQGCCSSSGSPLPYVCNP